MTGAGVKTLVGQCTRLVCQAKRRLGAALPNALAET